MKNFTSYFKLFLLLAAMVVGVSDADAYVYSKMVLYAGNGGTVALSADKTGAYNAIKSGNENAYGSSATMILESTTWYSGVKQGTLYFYAHAKANNGYYFSRWSTSNGGSSTSTDNPWHKGIKSGKVSQSNAVTETYYAVFAPTSYTITYNLDGGTNNANNPATYTIESATIILADPTRGGFIFDGWTTDGVSTPTKSLQIVNGSTGNKAFTAHWTPATLSQTITWNQSIATQQRNNVLTLNATASSGLTITYTASPADLVSISGNQVTCLKPGHVTITASQSGNDSYLAATSVSKEFDIYATPTIDCMIADQYFVDDAALNLATLWTRDGSGVIAYTIKSFTPSGVNNESATSPAITDGQLTFGQAGTLVLGMSVATNGYYNENNASKTIVVNKRTNPITITFDGDAEPGNAHNMAYGSGVNVVVASANAANTLTISQTAGDDIATYYADQEAVYTSYKNGTATWTVSQPENYKYLAGNATFSVNVNPASAGESCYLYEYTDEELSCSSFGQDRAKWDIQGVAGTLLFSARHQLASVNPKITVYQVVNGEASEVAQITNLGTSNKEYSFELNSNATKVCFVGSGTLSKYVSNVRVTRKTYFTTVPSNGSVLNMPACQLESSSEETITINYSRPRTSNNIHIECNNDHFVLSKSVIENVSCNNGSEDITVTFTPTGQDDEEGTITIYDESEIRTITVKGKTVSRVAPEIHWLMPAVVEYNKSFVGLNNIVESTNTESPIVITSSDETIASYDADTKTIATYEKSGKVTFTVHQDATDAFHEVDLQFSIIVSNESESLCLLTSNDDKHALGAYAESSYTISLDAPADKITYNMWKESASISSITVTWYNEEGNKISSRDYPVSDMSTSAKQFEMSLPRNARSVKFSAEGSIFDRTVNKNVSYIRVYRANYLEHNAVLSDGKLNFGEAEYAAADATVEFDVEYSGSGEFFVESSDQEHFALASVINRTIDCENGYGTQHVSVAYHHTTVGVQNATLTVQLGTDVLSIPLTGSTKRPSEAVFIGAEGDDWNNPDNWLGGVLPAAGDEISVRGELVIDNGETRTVESLVIEPTGSVLVVGNGSLIVNGAGTTATGIYGDLRIDKDGEVQLNMTDAEPLHVNNFYIESAPTAVSQTAASGQLENAEKLQFANAYIDITLAPAGVFDASQWYGFAVPFPVSVSDGVFQFNELGEVSKATDGVDYMIYYYDGMKRYNTGKGWTRMTGTLNPGEFYYLTVNDGHNVMRFQKTADGELVSADTKTITAYGDAAVKPADANWNAMGNPMLQHQNADGVDFVQIYVNGESRYETVSTADYSFVVGSPFFVQAASGTLDFNAASHAAFYAPGRVAAEESLFHAIELLNTSEKVCDRIYLAAGEKETNGYVLGSDLQKAGVTTRVAQMWIDRYGLKLSVNKETAISDETEFPVVFSAPATGEYILRATDAAADYSLYLMHNGNLVWDLSSSDYSIDLQKGNTAGYSIVMQHHMPGIATGMDAVSEKSGAEKVLVNGNLYIINQNAVYSAAGNRVK